jgi:hypothetical protein
LSDIFVDLVLFGLWLVCFEQHLFFQHEDVHIGRHKASVSVLGRTDNGFAADVETGVDDDGTAGFIFETLQEAIEPAVPPGVDGLDPCRVIDVGDAGDNAAFDFQFFDAV